MSSLEADSPSRSSSDESSTTRQILRLRDKLIEIRRHMDPGRQNDGSHSDTTSKVSSSSSSSVSVDREHAASPALRKTGNNFESSSPHEKSSGEMIDANAPSATDSVVDAKSINKQEKGYDEEGTEYLIATSPRTKPVESATSPFQPKKRQNAVPLVDYSPNLPCSGTRDQHRGNQDEYIAKICLNNQAESPSHKILPKRNASTSDISQSSSSAGNDDSDDSSISTSSSNSSTSSSSNSSSGVVVRNGTNTSNTQESAEYNPYTSITKLKEAPISVNTVSDVSHPNGKRISIGKFPDHNSSELAESSTPNAPIGQKKRSRSHRQGNNQEDEYFRCFNGDLKYHTMGNQISLEAPSCEKYSDEDKLSQHQLELLPSDVVKRVRKDRIESQTHQEESRTETSPCNGGVSLIKDRQEKGTGSMHEHSNMRTMDSIAQQYKVSPEIHFSICAPPPFREKPPPIIHYLSVQNRPLHSRRRIKIGDLFGLPVKLLWNKFENFNPLQSEVAQMLCHSDDNVVVAAPTGAGKTAVFEIAIARFLVRDLEANKTETSRGPQPLSNHRKIVYVAPSKALCEERFADWKSRLSRLHIGIRVAMITGDGEPGESFYELASAQFILTTPEKWDCLTRRWTENFFLMASVKLFMIDEVHVIGDGSRGSCLEAIIARMKSIQRAARSVSLTNVDLQSSRYVNGSTVFNGVRIRSLNTKFSKLPGHHHISYFIQYADYCRIGNSSKYS